MFEDLILLWNPEPPRTRLRDVCLRGQSWDCICRTLERRFASRPFVEPDVLEPPGGSTASVG